MKRILLVLTVICSICIHGMAQKINEPPAEKVLVANETEVIRSGKTGFRIITSNDTISNRFVKKFSGVFTKVTYLQKKDRKGGYWERSFYFKNDDWNTVVLFINNKFK